MNRRQAGPLTANTTGETISTAARERASAGERIVSAGSKRVSLPVGLPASSPVHDRDARQQAQWGRPLSTIDLVDTRLCTYEE